MTLRKNTGTVKKTVPATVIINPLTMQADNTEKYFQYLYLNCTDNTEFKKNTSYQLPAPYNIRCQFTHRVMLCITGEEVFFEVVAQEFPDTLLFSSYDVAAILTPENNGWEVVPQKNTFAIRFLSTIDPVKMTAGESRLLGAVLLRAKKKAIHMPAGLTTLQLDDDQGGQLHIHAHLARAVVARYAGDGAQM